MSWKHEAFWLSVALTAVAGLLLGIFIGAIATSEPPKAEPVKYEIRILPSPIYYGEGKRSEPGVLSPETIRTLEFKEIFNNGRDPFAGGKP